MQHDSPTFFIEKFHHNSNRYLSFKEIKQVLDDEIRNTQTGKKFLSKKHRERLHGHRIIKHIADRKTLILMDIIVQKRRISYDFSVVNWFSTEKGVIYLYRQGVETPNLFFFSGHFFDRLSQRVYDGELNRAEAIAEFTVSLHKTKMGAVVIAKEVPGPAYLVTEHGLGLGHAEKAEAPPGFHSAFVSELLQISRPNEVLASAFITFVTKEMLGREQKEIYDLGLKQMNDPGLDAD